MTIAMDDVPVIDTNPTPANMRGAKDFGKARRHSSYVWYLKGLLPVAAVSMVGIFAAFAITTYAPVLELGVDGLGMRSGNLVMHKPKMAGFDKNRNPYAVNAVKAIQNLKKPGIIQLRNIDAKFPMDAKTTAHIDADNGVYDSNSEKMLLTDNVKVTGARGMDISMQEADIDVNSGAMVSNKPVEVVSKDTNITSNSLIVENNGERIIFKERVRMTIKKPVSRGVNPVKKSN